MIWGDYEKSNILSYFGLNKEQQEYFDKMITDLMEIRESIFETGQANKEILEQDWNRNKELVNEFFKEVIGFNDNVNIDVFVSGKKSGAMGEKGKIQFGPMGAEGNNVVYLAHEALHAKILPYLPGMKREERNNIHSVIQYLADKELNFRLTGESYLSLGVHKGTRESMKNMYPFFLGYLYRNNENAEDRIRQAILRDYVASKKTEIQDSGLKGVSFLELDSKKIADYFTDKKDISLYEFCRLDFTRGRALFLVEEKSITQDNGDDSVNTSSIEEAINYIAKEEEVELQNENAEKSFRKLELTHEQLQGAKITNEGECK